MTLPWHYRQRHRGCLGLDPIEVRLPLRGVSYGHGNTTTQSGAAIPMNRKSLRGDAIELIMAISVSLYHLCAVLLRRGHAATCLEQEKLRAGSRAQNLDCITLALGDRHHGKHTIGCYNTRRARSIFCIPCVQHPGLDNCMLLDALIQT